MDLHGNAALSWSGRRQLARRVVDQGWTLTAAAEAAGVSVRCARRWVGRYREGDSDLFDRSSAPRRVANRTDPERITMIAKLRRLRMTAAEIAETLSMPLSTVSGILTRIGMGRPGWGSSRPSATSAPGRASSSTSTSRSWAGSSAAPASAGATTAISTTPAATPTRRVGCTRRRVGSTSTSPSTTTAASPTPKCSPTRKPPPPSDSSAVPLPSTAATASTSRPCSATTAPPTSRSSTRSPAADYGSNTSAPGPTGHRQTGRRSALSARCSPAGPTAPSTAQATNAHTPLTAGSGTTDENQVLDAGRLLCKSSCGCG